MTRLRGWYWWQSYRLRYELPEAVRWRIAWLVPRSIAALVLARMAGGASSGKYGTTTPDQLTYDVIYTRFVTEGIGR